MACATSFVIRIPVSLSFTSDLEGSALEFIASVKSLSINAHITSGVLLPRRYSPGVNKWSTTGAVPNRVTSSKFDHARKNLASATARFLTSVSGSNKSIIRFDL